MSAAGELCVLAPAKVNLVLRVLGRRADGFHEVETLLCALAHDDVLRARWEPVGAGEPEGAEPRLILHGPAADPELPTGPDNLALGGARAALARLPGRSQEPRRLVLELEKHLPAQAGLGGGSADAAAAALATARLAGLDVDDPRWMGGLGEGSLNEMCIAMIGVIPE